MPPKVDPYSTRSARAVDLVLILFAIVVIVLAVWSSPRLRMGSEHGRQPAQPKVSFAANAPADYP